MLHGVATFRHTDILHVLRVPLVPSCLKLSEHVVLLTTLIQQVVIFVYIA